MPQLTQEQKEAIRKMLAAKYEIDEETIDRAVLRAEEYGMKFPEHMAEYLDLRDLFIWGGTPEGFHFWNNIFENQAKE